MYVDISSDRKEERDGIKKGGELYYRRKDRIGRSIIINDKSDVGRRNR